ncbi:MAG: FGGY-family carbohydrate kinase [Firmicutes bacterium]|nr:FGGY-family carbohydrate kinase [Bacillota bacterium]
MEQDLIIGIDSGTQSVRVIIFDLKGQTVAYGSAIHAPCTTLQNGGVEQDPTDIWQCFCQACRQAMSALPSSPSRIAACSITSQRSTMLAVDEKGNALRPAFSWMDQRKNEEISASLPERHRMIQSGAKAHWMKINEPAVYDAVHCFLPVSGWLTRRLCGSFYDCEGSVAGIWPFDIEKLAWSEDAQLYEAYGLLSEKLPRVFPPGELLGRITREAAAETGLPEGLALRAGSGDKMCEMLGAGAIQLDQGYITYGSMAGLEVNILKPFFAPAGEYWTNPAAVPGMWNLEFAVQRGYLMLSWFTRQFNLGEDIGCSGEEFLGREAQALPAGSDGLVVAPYWMPTQIARGARSVIIGLDDHHSRAHLFRAVLEGTAYALRQGMNRMVEDTGHPLTETVAGGGGARSDLVLQITADVIGLPVWRVQTADTCSLGTAILAAVGEGLCGSFADAVDRMVLRRECFEPHPRRQAVYTEIYQKIYEGIYPSMKQVYDRFNEVFEAIRREEE